MLETAKPPILGHVRSEEPKPEAQRAGRGVAFGRGGSYQGQGQSIMFGGLEPRAWRAREREPITGVQGEGPWSEGQGPKPP